jgi:hypothetical protein
MANSAIYTLRNNESKIICPGFSNKRSGII